MDYINFKEATNLLGKPKGVKEEDCGSLPVMILPGGDDNMGAYFISFWKPSPEDLTKLISGEFIRLTIRGLTHPPVMITVAPAEEVK